MNLSDFNKEKLNVVFATDIDKSGPIIPRRYTLTHSDETGINSKDLTHFSYQRYLENKIRENFGFEGTSMQFEYKEKDRKR